MAERQGSFQVTPGNEAATLAKAEEARQEATGETPAADDAAAAASEAPAEGAEAASDTGTSAEEEVAAAAAEAKDSSDDEGEAEGEESEAAAGDFNIDTYAQEFQETGALSEESQAKVIEALTPILGPDAAGYVEAFMQGRGALEQVAVMGAHSLVGGEENYKAMLEWAEQGLSQEDAAAFNAAVANPQSAGFAIKALYEKFQASGGAPQRSMRAQGAPSQQGVAPIRSRAELAKIVGSHEYKTDPAFREEVHRRLEASRNSGQYTTRER